MEKKTIGKFISVLRRANGMTQRELAEKLFVSDKTVSRWECDECTPDLALIPVIAELFGVTSDELLRGERKNPEYSEPEGGRYALKSEKQFKKLLDARLKKYGNLTLISLGLALVGWLMGVLCNFAFYNGVLGFVLATVFFLASEICQVCFTRSMRIPFDEEEGYHVRVQEINWKMARAMVWISFLNIALFAYTLPLAFTGGVMGLRLEAWLVYGGSFVLVALVVSALLYFFAVRPSLVAKEQLRPEPELEKKFKRTGLIGGVVAGIAGVLAIGVFIVNVVGWQSFAEYEHYTDTQAFKHRMESDFDRWYEGGLTYETINGVQIFSPPTGDAELNKSYGVIYDEQGRKVEFYYYKDMYETIVYGYDGAGNKTSATILTVEAFHKAWIAFEGLQTILWCLLPVDIAGGVIVYVILSVKDKSKE